MNACDLVENAHRKYLPLEIWEKILAYLEPRQLLRAARVCVRWRYLVERICRRYCQNNLHKSLIKELFDTAEVEKQIHHKKTVEENVKKTDDEPDWIHITQLYSETNFESKGALIMPQFCSIEGFINLDPFFVIWTLDQKEHINHYIVHLMMSYNSLSCRFFAQEQAWNDRINDLLDRRWELTTVTDKVLKALLLSLSSSVILLLLTVSKIEPFLIDTNSCRAEIEMTFIRMSPALSPHQKTVTEKDLFLTPSSRNVNELILYKGKLSQLELQMGVMMYIELYGSPLCCNISNNFVSTIESSGHVRTYKITVSGASNMMGPKDLRSDLVAKSLLVKDLCYPNPSLIENDFVFTSTITSREMLAYWHMDRERDYWMYGCTNPTVIQPELSDTAETTNADVVANISLKKWNFGREITSLYYQRGCIFCGTKLGDLLIYRCTQMEKKSDFSLSNLEEDPIIQLKVFEEPISRVSALFTLFGAIAVVATKDLQWSFVYFPLQD